MIDVNKENFIAEVEESRSTVLIDLYAEWCAPCKMIAPVLAELEEQYPSIKFCRVNVDACPDIAAMFRVESIPMLAIVKDNTFVDFIVGYNDKKTIAQFIDSNT